MELLKDERIKFLIVGGSIFVVGFIGMKVLVDVLHVNPSLAFIILSVISVESNFLLNYYWSWRGAGKGWKDFWQSWVKFHIARTISIPLNQLLFNLLILLRVHYLVALFATTAVLTVYSYIAAERFIFSKRK